MKAEKILRLIERAREPLLKEAHIRAYAQAMIEKDREQLKTELLNNGLAGFSWIINNTFETTIINLD